jgi:hypothetical protein
VFTIRGVHCLGCQLSGVFTTDLSTLTHLGVDSRIQRLDTENNLHKLTSIRGLLAFKCRCIEPFRSWQLCHYQGCSRSVGFIIKDVHYKICSLYGMFTMLGTFTIWGVIWDVICGVPWAIYYIGVLFTIGDVVRDVHHKGCSLSGMFIVRVFTIRGVQPVSQASTCYYR